MSLAEKKRNGNLLLVLFDFERIGFGNPAVDLAITMPGFGAEDGSLENEIAVKYISFWKENDLTFPYTVDEFITHIQIAKLWVSLDFLANNFNTLNEQSLDIFVDRLTEKIKHSC